MAVISISYNDGNKKNLGYKSVNLSYDDLKKKKSFNSGDFVKDWYDCMKFNITNDITDKEPLMHSSSVNHFIMDGAKFDSAYLHADKNQVELKYVDESDPHYLYTQRDIYEKGIEFFVKEGTKPTWDELRALCNDAKKDEQKATK